jgi:hypothetical protein
MREASMTSRRFPAPWQVEQIPGGYKVLYASGQALAYIYARDTREQADIAKVLTFDEARRIAVNVARLPEVAHGAIEDAGDRRCCRNRTRRGTSRLDAGCTQHSLLRFAGDHRLVSAGMAGIAVWRWIRFWWSARKQMAQLTLVWMRLWLTSWRTGEPRQASRQVMLPRGGHGIDDLLLRWILREGAGAGENVRDEVLKKPLHDL